jgi:hypothetical protein
MEVTTKSMELFSVWYNSLGNVQKIAYIKLLFLAG